MFCCAETVGACSVRLIYRAMSLGQCNAKKILRSPGTKTWSPSHIVCRPYAECRNRLTVVVCLAGIFVPAAADAWILRHHVPSAVLEPLGSCTRRLRATKEALAAWSAGQGCGNAARDRPESAWFDRDFTLMRCTISRFRDLGHHLTWPP